jgi:hypothetical protein
VKEERLAGRRVQRRRHAQWPWEELEGLRRRYLAEQAKKSFQNTVGRWR